MSEQDPNAPQYTPPPAAAPPPPPAPAAAPPPPPAPQPVAAPPAYTTAPPPPPAPRKRPVWLIVVIAAVLLICLPALCVGSFAVSAARQSAQTREAVEQAESHYSAATDALEKASGSLSEYGESGEGSDMQEAEASIRAARDKLAAARVAIEPLDASEGRDAYLASLDAATEALEGIERLLGAVRILTQLSGQLESGMESVKAADERLDDAIDAGNDEKYAAMKSKATAASARYATAIAIVEAAHKLDTAAGLDVLVDYIKLRKKQADLSVKMAADGTAGRVAAYNKKVAEQKKLDAQAKKAGEPAMVSDPEWLAKRVGADEAAFQEAGEKADALRKQALEAFGFDVE